MEMGYGVVRVFLSTDQFEVINDQIQNDASIKTNRIYVFSCENEEVKKIANRVVDGFGDQFTTNGHTVYVVTHKEVSDAIAAMSVSQDGISFEYMDMNE